ncbi:MAG: hypothetical protein JJE40_19890, partial [Vicinamibacteria bacterium]|nr:hypothetical protein [Vicinamibacteria bacterium]
VARLAGLPAAVVARAREILDGLEQDELARGGRPTVTGAQREPVQQLGLFAPTSAVEDRITARLREVDVNRLTPLDALTLLADLKRDAES